jgi:hypothetical protein
MTFLSEVKRPPFEPPPVEARFCFDGQEVADRWLKQADRYIIPSMRGRKVEMAGT